jgi:polysaccharide export outer membrane protein
MWVARPAGHFPGSHQLLPVNWFAIAQKGDPTTNYQLAHNDRIYIKADARIHFNSELDKTLNPIERLFGVTLLGSTTVNSIKRGGTIRNNNNNNTNNLNQ